MSANVGLAIQCVGIVLLALLSLSMGGSIKSVALKCWTLAGISLSLALVSLFVGFHISPGHKLFYSVYFFGEYSFGLMFIGGCRFLASAVRINHRGYLMLLPAAIVATVLPYASADFNDLFMVQATINDTLGHSVGDKAIRAVARAVRSLIRADDMLFRWGGDEFLVLMFKLDEDEASRRMRSLNDILQRNGEQWTSANVTITVSTGVCGFTSIKELGQAIEEADRLMYEGWQQARKSDQMSRDFSATISAVPV